MACDNSNCKNYNPDCGKADRDEFWRAQKDNESRYLSVLAMVVFELVHLLFAFAMLWSDTPLVDIDIDIDIDDVDLDTLTLSVNCGIFCFLALISTLVATACSMERKDQRQYELHGLVVSPVLFSLLFIIWTMLGPGERIFPVSASGFFIPLFCWLRAGFWLEAWFGAGSFLLGKAYKLFGIRGRIVLAACL